MGIHAYAMGLLIWGKGGYGGSPNVEAGKMYQHFYLVLFLELYLSSINIKFVIKGSGSIICH